MVTVFKLRIVRGSGWLPGTKQTDLANYPLLQKIKAKYALTTRDEKSSSIHKMLCKVLKCKVFNF